MSDASDVYYEEETRMALLDDLKRANKWRTLNFVINDLVSRENKGMNKYGAALDYQTRDDMLQHLYEELLDGAMYIKTLMLQREAHGEKKK
jgi:hypothetical protein